MRAEALPEDSAGSDESPDGSGDFSLRALARRVEQIKRDEARGTTTMPVIVLDATLPGQRLGLRFDRKDTRRALNAGTSLGPLAEVGDAFAMLGQAPRSGQVLPFGVEVTVSRVRDFPDGSGDVEVELVGRRLRADRGPALRRERRHHGEGGVHGFRAGRAGLEKRRGRRSRASRRGRRREGRAPAAATRGQRKETSSGDTEDDRSRIRARNRSTRRRTRAPRRRSRRSCRSGRRWCAKAGTNAEKASSI